MLCDSNAVHCQEAKCPLEVSNDDPKEGKIIFLATEELIIQLGKSTNSQETTINILA